MRKQYRRFVTFLIALLMLFGWAFIIGAHAAPSKQSYEQWSQNYDRTKQIGLYNDTGYDMRISVFNAMGKQIHGTLLKNGDHIQLPVPEVGEYSVCWYTEILCDNEHVTLLTGKKMVTGFMHSLIAITATPQCR